MANAVFFTEVDNGHWGTYNNFLILIPEAASSPGSGAKINFLKEIKDYEQTLSVSARTYPGVTRHPAGPWPPPYSPPLAAVFSEVVREQEGLDLFQTKQEVLIIASTGLAPWKGPSPTP